MDPAKIALDPDLDPAQSLVNFTIFDLNNYF